MPSNENPRLADANDASRNDSTDTVPDQSLLKAAAQATVAQKAPSTTPIADRILARKVKKKEQQVRFDLIATETIMHTVYPPAKWIVPGIIQPGFSVLGGVQKLGKTWIGINTAVAVATGGMAFGNIKCEQGRVLYLDLENGNEIIQERIFKICGTTDPAQLPNLSQLKFVGNVPDLYHGLLKCIENDANENGKPRLIVIDTLQRVKPWGGDDGSNAYEQDAEIWGKLHDFCLEIGIPLLCLHHVKKGVAEDKVEKLTGSNGLGASCDSIMVLDSAGANGSPSLYVKGRRGPEINKALRFDEERGTWHILGDIGEVQANSERQAIVDLLREDGEIMSLQQIAMALDKNKPAVSNLLKKMVADGSVLKVGTGKYQAP